MKVVKSTVVAVVLAASVAGCSGSSATKSAATSATSKAGSAASSAGSSATSTSASASSSASASAPSASASAPAGSQMIEASVSKVSIAVPAGWAVLDESNVTDQAMLKKLEPFAKRQNVSSTRLAQSYLAIADVVAFDPASTAMVGDSINIGKVTQPALPTQQQYKDEFAKIGAKTVKYQHITTPAGPGVEETYTLSGKGVTIHGASLAVPNGQGSYSAVTVSSLDEAKTTKYAQAVIDSAHKN